MSSHLRRWIAFDENEMLCFENEQIFAFGLVLASEDTFLSFVWHFSSDLTMCSHMSNIRWNIVYGGERWILWARGNRFTRFFLTIDLITKFDWLQNKTLAKCILNRFDVEAVVVWYSSIKLQWNTVHSSRSQTITIYILKSYLHKMHLIFHFYDFLH